MADRINYPSSVDSDFRGIIREETSQETDDIPIQKSPNTSEDVGRKTPKFKKVIKKILNNPFRI